MSFIEMNLDDVQEPQTAPEGEYELVIDNAEVGLSKTSGKPRIAVRIAFDCHPELQSMLHFISLPTEDDDPSSANFKKLMLKRFLYLFNIPCDGGFNVEDLFGARATAAVRLSEPSDSNEVYNELILPKLPRE